MSKELKAFNIAQLKCKGKPFFCLCKINQFQLQKDEYAGNQNPKSQREHLPSELPRIPLKKKRKEM